MRIVAALRARPAAGVAVLIAALLLAAVPTVAFVVVPLFVRSTLHEAAPAAQATAAPSAAATPAPAPDPLLTCELRRLDPVHYGTGRVTISDAGGSRYLLFENVEIAGAPNMFVYLSDRADGQPGTFTDLGPLKATSGSFNYELRTDLDLQGVRSVVVWCKAFSVPVTYAPLQRQS